jgi:hypothetical protein
MAPISASVELIFSALKTKGNVMRGRNIFLFEKITFFYRYVWEINLNHWYLNFSHVMFLWMEIEIAIFFTNGEDLNPCSCTRQCSPLFWSLYMFHSITKPWTNMLNPCWSSYFQYTLVYNCCRGRWRLAWGYW